MFERVLPIVILVLAAEMTVGMAPAHAALSAQVDAGDRARIAMLVYQSASARQADLRKGDQATRALRTRAESAEGKVRAIKSEIAALRADGVTNRHKARALEKQLEAHEKTLTESAEKYAEELSKRDQAYARERTILISTGQRLATTPEGRRALDLYNAGGQANWNDARRVLDEARRVRRALDNRDAAKLYFEAYRRGLETNASVTALYEDVVRDDPKNSEDWVILSELYHAAGQKALQLRAAEQLAKLTSDELTQFAALRVKARAHADETTKAAQADYEAAIEFALNSFRRSPDQTSNMMAGVALWEGSYPFLALEEWDRARERLERAISHLRAARNPKEVRPSDSMLVMALVHFGDTFHNIDQYEAAVPHYRAAVALARELKAQDPKSSHVDDGLFSALEAIGVASSEAGQPEEASAFLYEALSIVEQQRVTDPGVVLPNDKLINVLRYLGQVESDRGRHNDAIKHLERSLQVIAVNFRTDPTYWPRELGARVRLGKSYAKANRIPDARAEYGRAIQVGRKVLAESPNSEIAIWNFSEALLALGENSIAAGQRHEARATWEEADKLLKHGLNKRPSSKILLEAWQRAERLRKSIFGAPATVSTAADVVTTAR